MSTKTSILLTEDNEHWYSDCAEPLDKTNDAITLEFSKKNVRIDLNDEDDIVLTIINPNCEIYNIIKNLACLSYDEKTKTHTVKVLSPYFHD